jgi:hypothetical protein
MSTDQEGNGFSGYSFNDSMGKYRDKHLAQRLEQEVKEQARQQAEKEELQLKQKADVDQLVAQQNAYEEAMDPAERQALNERRVEQMRLRMAERKSKGPKSQAHLQLEVMRACLCRI